MFNNQQFYHKHTKKAIIAFGTIFNQINIRRLDSLVICHSRSEFPLHIRQNRSSYLGLHRYQMPLPEEKWQSLYPEWDLRYLDLILTPVERYHLSKKTLQLVLDKENTFKKGFVSTPYDMQMGLYIFAKNQEDALQIVEQILPYFNPDFSVTVNDLPELGIKRDIKIVMDSVAFEDDYEGDFASRRSIIWTMTFTMKLNYYGFVADQGFIRKSIAQTYENADLQGTVYQTDV